MRHTQTVRSLHQILLTRSCRPRWGLEFVDKFQKTRENRRSRGKCEDMQYLNENKLVTLLGFGAFFFILFLWNYLQPLTADDYGYSITDALYQGKLINVIYHRYFTWSGRISADILVFSVLAQHSIKYMLPIINLLNSVALFGIIYVLCKFSCGNKVKLKHFYYIGILYIAYFVIIHTFAQDFLWKTVAIQYAWGMCLLLIVMWRFYQDWRSPVAPNKIYLLYLLVFGTLIGLYNEIFVAFVGALYLAGLITCYIFDKNKIRALIRANYMIFLLGVMIGGLILVVAPGNYARQETYLPSHHINSTSYGFLAKIAMTYVRFFRYGYHVLFAFLLIFIGISTYKKRHTMPRELLVSITFLLTLLNLHILSFVEVAYYSAISGRMLILMDSIIFMIFIKYILWRTRLFELVLHNYVWTLGVFLLIYVSFSYYKLHQFIVKQQEQITQNTQVKLSQLELNRVLRYVIYFDQKRTDDKTFSRYYLDNGLN